MIPSRILTISLLFIAAFSPHPMGGRLQAEPVAMGISAAMGEEVGYGRAMQTLVQEIRAATGGQIKPRLFLSGSAGGEADALKLQLSGHLEAGFTSATVLAHTLPAFRLLALPMLFPTPEAVLAFPDSPLGERLTTRGPQGKLVVLGYASYGFYGVLGFRSDNTLDRMRVRLPLDDWLFRVHRALMMRPVQVPADSLEQGFSSGWLHGVVSTPELLAPSGLPPSANQFFQTRHLHGWAVFTANRTWYEGLAPPLREGLAKAAAAVTRQALRQAMDREETLLAQWETMRQPAVVRLAPEPLARAVAAVTLQAAREIDPLLGEGELASTAWRALYPALGDTPPPVTASPALDESERDLPLTPDGVPPREEESEAFPSPDEHAGAGAASPTGGESP